MLEWVPVIRSIVKTIGALRKEAKGIGTDWNQLADEKSERAAMVDLATLRFDAATRRKRCCPAQPAGSCAPKILSRDAQPLLAAEELAQSGHEIADVRSAGGGVRHLTRRRNALYYQIST